MISRLIGVLGTPGGHLFAHGFLLVVMLSVGLMVHRFDARTRQVDADNAWIEDEVLPKIHAEQKAQRADADAMWKWAARVDLVLRSLTGQQIPDEQPTDQFEIPFEDTPIELPATDAMPTVESHAADMGLRKLATLNRGQHRESGGGRTVDEILAELGLPHTAGQLTQRQGEQ